MVELDIPQKALKNDGLWVLMCAGGEFRTRDLQIMSIALVGEPLEFTN